MSWTKDNLRVIIRSIIRSSFSDFNMDIVTFKKLIESTADRLANELWTAILNGDLIISVDQTNLLRAKENEYKTKLLNIINKINDNSELFSLQAENEKFRQQLERISNIANNPLEPIQYNDK